jgi:two-component system cell cycle response regulator DivK
MALTLQGTRIFYIEDDVMNRLVVQTMLEAHGVVLNFDPWGFPEVTIFKLARFRPNLILLDLMFPNQNSGYDIFAAIRRQHTLSRIPVVAVSAADPSVEIPKARELGFAGFISKPLDIRRFPEQITTVLKGEQVWYSD